MATEGEILAKYLLSVKPDAKVAILMQNDDSVCDYVSGFKKGLGDKASIDDRKRSHLRAHRSDAGLADRTTQVFGSRYVLQRLSGQGRVAILQEGLRTRLEAAAARRQPVGRASISRVCRT